MFTTFQRRSSAGCSPRPRYKSRSYAQQRNMSGGGGATAGLSNANYATGLLHIALTGASGWAIHECNEKSPIALGCFTFLLGHSLLGVLRHTHPNVQESIATVYQHTQLLAQICPIAMITAQVSLHLSEPVRNAYLYGLVALVPTVCELVLPEQNERALDLVVLGTCTSLGYMGVMKDRYWAMGLAVLTVLNHFAYRPVADEFKVPRTDLITLGLGFFTMFAVNCLAETSA